MTDLNDLLRGTAAPEEPEAVFTADGGARGLPDEPTQDLGALIRRELGLGEPPIDHSELLRGL